MSSELFYLIGMAIGFFEMMFLDNWHIGLALLLLMGFLYLGSFLITINIDQE